MYHTYNTPISTLTPPSTPIIPSATSSSISRVEFDYYPHANLTFQPSLLLYTQHPPTTANMTSDIVSYNRGQAQSFGSLPSARRLFLYIIPLEARLVHDNMMYTGESLPHAAHAAHTAHSRWWAAGRLVLALHDSHLGCAEERCHTGGVDETGADDLEGIQDAIKRLDCDT